MKGQGRSRRLVGYFTDGSELIELVWFAGEKYVTQKYSVGQEYIVFGKPKRWGKVFTMPHPEIEPYEGENRRADIGFRTMYNTTDTMKKHYLHSSALRDIIANLLNNVEVDVPETLPPYLIERYRLISRREAIYNMHLPRNQALLDAATRRLKFEELFYIQMSILRQSVARQEKSEGFVMDRVDIGDLGALIRVGGLLSLEVGLLAVSTAAGLVDVLGSGEQAPENAWRLQTEI